LRYTGIASGTLDALAPPAS